MHFARAASTCTITTTGDKSFIFTIQETEERQERKRSGKKTQSKVAGHVVQPQTLTPDNSIQFSFDSNSNMC